MNTTRKFPRSLLEAFPADHWRGVVTHYPRPTSEKIADAIFATILGICGAALLFHFLAA